MHVAVSRGHDLRIYEHPGLLPLSFLPRAMYRISATVADTNTNISLSTRHGHVFSAGALTLDLDDPPCPLLPRPQRQILVDPFKTRSATHKGSALSYARYYTLYRISFHLLSLSGQGREKKEGLEARATRVLVLQRRYACTYTCTPTHCGSSL